MPTDTYTTAQALASDLAEDELVHDMTEAMIEYTRAAPRAKAIRARSEAQKASSGPVGQTHEDRYAFTQRTIYGAVYALLEGYKGWRLVRDTLPLTTPCLAITIMGCGPFKTCRTNASPTATPPNPSPDRWTYLDHAQYADAYALKVRYLDCTNYEGVKVMVYRGQYRPRPRLDPHFTRDTDSPIARFRPDEVGWRLACVLAMSLGL